MAVLTLVAITHSSPQAVNTVHWKKTFDENDNDIVCDHDNCDNYGSTVHTYQNVNFVCYGFSDLITNRVFWTLEVVPGVPGVVHEGEEVILHPDQLEVLALHVRHLHVVGRGTDILKLLACNASQIQPELLQHL